MTSNHKNKSSNEVGVELKYCEHCGGLWVRECGSGMIYCQNCQPVVADLPAPKKRAHRMRLPARTERTLENSNFEIGIEDSTEFEAAGGVA
jgi:Zn-finger nucleic acid-binding protein